MAVDELSKRFRGGLVPIAAKTVASLSIVFLLLLTIRHFRFQFLPIFRIWSIEKYLQQTERTVSIAEWVNQNLPQNAKVLSLNEPHLFYFDREVVLDREFNIRTHYKDKDSPKSMVAFLKEKGITHILDTENISGQILPDYGDSKIRPIDSILKDQRFAQPLTWVRSSNVINRRSQHTLYQLI